LVSLKGVTPWFENSFGIQNKRCCCTDTHRHIGRPPILATPIRPNYKAARQKIDFTSAVLANTGESAPVANANHPLGAHHREPAELPAVKLKFAIRIMLPRRQHRGEMPVEQALLREHVRYQRA